MWAIITCWQQYFVKLVCSDLQGLPLIQHMQGKSLQGKFLPMTPSLRTLVSDI